MGDIIKQESDTLSSLHKEETQSLHREAEREPTSDAAPSPSELTASSITEAQVPLISNEQQASDVQQFSETPHTDIAHSLSVPLDEPITSVPLPQVETTQITAESFQGPSRSDERSAKQDKGKGRAVPLPKPVKSEQLVSVLPTQKSCGLLRVPSLTLADASKGHNTSGPSSSGATHLSAGGNDPKSTFACKGSNDYPCINGPRAIYRTGRSRYRPYRKLPRPRRMSNHRVVTVYAGEPLFHLCESVPFILGPLVLITRLQLLIETSVPLPDEVRHLVACKGVDVASLGEFDLALLNILGCLWDD